VSSGLLLGGQLVPTPGVTVIPPASYGGPSWCRLDPGDYMARPGGVQLVVIHTTGGRWPQRLVSGAGPSGHARQVLEMWSGADRGGGERAHSAAPLVVDHDGTVYCAADILRCAAYHATAVNARAVGIEMSTFPDGSITTAALAATAQLCALLTWSGADGGGLLSIPAQMPGAPYRGAPLRRLELGGRQTDGRDVVGVIGHRDQTAQRGAGDPGDAIWTRLAALGFEAVDYDSGQDLDLGRARQRWLVAHGAALTVDGIVGPASLAAARAQRFVRWRDVPQLAA